MSSTEITIRTASIRAPRCTWCGERMEKGTKYKSWTSFIDGPATSRVHFECKTAMEEELDQYETYELYGNERPK